MHLLLCCVIGLSAVVVGDVIDIQPYKQLLLDKSNEYRKMQHASNMNKLVWDDQLAKEAGDWISRCVFEHQVKGRGENLAYMVNDTLSPKEMTTHLMQGWYDEINMYSYAGKKCISSCHYTQMVWGETNKIGCAMRKCGAGTQMKNAFYLACFYDPLGNNEAMFPYLKGDACSKCRMKQGCEDGLCTGKGIQVCENTDKMCESWAEAGDCKDEMKLKSYMKKDCRKACNLCDSDDIMKEEKCVDESDRCAKMAWACKTTDKFMKINCKKTCGKC